VARDTVLLRLEDLLNTLGGGITLTRSKLQALAGALEAQGIGLELDPRDGARMPKPQNKVALFALAAGEAHSRPTPAYQVAFLTLDLASAVATTDGEFSAEEIDHLHRQIQGWSHLTPYHRRRLLAHLRLRSAEPMTLAALKKKLEPLGLAEKEAIAAFMATVAQADGTVSPQEVKLLEKVYASLGVDAKRVFSDLHAVAAGDATAMARAKAAAQAGFALDAERIAALQQDTHKVSALLSSIFTETEEDAAPAIEPEPIHEEAARDTGILGLDETHSTFARLLLSRPKCNRPELEDAASDLELMLDGALETLNEAAFDACEMPFTEGDDPIEISAEIVEKLAA
jgi:tellurite resistance protein